MTKNIKIKKAYRVLLNGENLFFRKDEQIEKMGFYTTRFVEAEGVEQAGNIAIELIWADSDLWAMTVNNSSCNGIITIEEIEAVAEIQSQLGYVFYSDKNNHD